MQIEGRGVVDTHHREELYPYQATSKGSLAQHKRAVHEGVKYSCGQCVHQATSNGDLARHKRAVHEGVKFSCRQCGKQFTRKSRVMQHQRTIHV